MAADPRTDRLRASVLAVPPAALRDAVRGIPEATVRGLPARARPLVAQLKRSSNPSELLRRLPDLQVVALLADPLSHDCLYATRDALGDAADDPTREQLVAALGTVLEAFAVETVRVMLATVALSDAEAADICDALLVEDERFAIAIPEAAAPTSRAPKPPIPDEVKERRRERKEAERARKARGKVAGAAPARRKVRTDDPAPATIDADVDVPATSRRAPTNLSDGFDPDDPLAGSVVIAHVPFDDELGAKPRPAVVVAGAPDELLVRPGYSEGGVQSRMWQSYELRDLAAAGCTKPTWIETETRVVRRTDASDPIGRLSDDDWNALW